jgi:hypothetical protein
MNFCKFFLAKLAKTTNDGLFEDIIGYYNIKKLFNMALASDSAVHILLVCPPASAKNMFLTSLMHLKNSYFADGAISTKAGTVDYLFKDGPKYLLLDETAKR